MRQVKRLLALVLALVMTLSLTAINASADWKSNGRKVTLPNDVTLSGKTQYTSITVTNGATVTIGVKADLTGLAKINVQDGLLIVAGKASTTDLTIGEDGQVSFAIDNAQLSASGETKIYTDTPFTGADNDQFKPTGDVFAKTEAGKTVADTYSSGKTATVKEDLTDDTPTPTPTPDEPTPTTDGKPDVTVDFDTVAVIGTVKGSKAGTLSITTSGVEAPKGTKKDALTKGEDLSFVLTMPSTYSLKTFTVTMGGTDVTDKLTKAITTYVGGSDITPDAVAYATTYTLKNVTGDVVITAKSQANDKATLTFKNAIFSSGAGTELADGKIVTTATNTTVGGAGEAILNAGIGTNAAALKTAGVLTVTPIGGNTSNLLTKITLPIGTVIQIVDSNVAAGDGKYEIADGVFGTVANTAHTLTFVLSKSFERPCPAPMMRL